MAKVNKINHIALVVEDIGSALEFWEDSLGIKLDHIEDVPQERSKVAFLPVGGCEIELVQPTETDSGLAKFLEKRGPGMHHICLEVDDIQSVLADLKRKGIRLINETALERDDGRQYAFIHPKAANGVLVELYQLPMDSMPAFPILETERLVLRQFRPSDVPAVFDLYARSDMNPWLEHESLVSLEEAENRVESRIQLFERGCGCRWAIFLKPDLEQVIGSCGYFSVRTSTQTVEMEFDVHPDLWRQNIMTEALSAVFDHVFVQSVPFPVHRIEALIDPGNQASVGLLEALGFRKEGVRRKFGYWKGAYQDVILFALLKNDWSGST